MNEPALHAHRLLLRAGLSLIHAFAWIFVFEYFYFLSGGYEDLSISIAPALSGVVLLYALVQLITIVATPVSAAHLRRGTKHALVWGVTCAAGGFILLGSTLEGTFGVPFLWGIVGFAVLMGIYRALYWVPYKILRTEMQPHMYMRAYLEVLVALMPLFAGLTVSSVTLGQGQLLFGAAALLLLSAAPVFFLSDTQERFSWSYAYTFKQIFRRKNHGLVLQSMLEGLQGAALFLVWPLAIFVILDWSYFMLGLVFTGTLLLVLLLRRSYRWMMERSGLADSALTHSVLVVSGWIARLAAGTPVGVIVANVYAFTTEPERSTFFDPVSFEHASDRGSFVDEYTALKEIALGFGKIMLCAIVFFVVPLFAPVVVFAIALGIAAVASGISLAVARREAAPAY